MDNGFSAIDSPAQLHGLEIPSTRTSLLFNFKLGVLDLSLFRGDRGKVISRQYVWQKLQQLSTQAGFPDPVTPYALRRGAGNVIDSRFNRTIDSYYANVFPESSSSAERDQIMGHHDGIFSCHYLSSKVKFDAQAAFLNRDPRKGSAEMSLEMDSMCPQELSPAELRVVMQQDDIQDAIREMEESIVGASPKVINRARTKARMRTQRANARALRNKQKSFNSLRSDEIIASQLAGNIETVPVPRLPQTVPRAIFEMLEGNSFHELVAALVQLERAPVAC